MEINDQIAELPFLLPTPLSKLSLCKLNKIRRLAFHSFVLLFASNLFTESLKAEKKEIEQLQIKGANEGIEEMRNEIYSYLVKTDIKYSRSIE